MRGFVKGRSEVPYRQTVHEGLLLDPERLCNLTIAGARSARANLAHHYNDRRVGSAVAVLARGVPGELDDLGRRGKSLPPTTKVLSGGNYRPRPYTLRQTIRDRRVCGETATYLAGEEGDLFLGPWVVFGPDDMDPIEGVRRDRRFLPFCTPCYGWLSAWLPGDFPALFYNGDSELPAAGMYLRDLAPMYDENVPHPEYFTGLDALEFAVEAMAHQGAATQFSRLHLPQKVLLPEQRTQ